VSFTPEKGERATGAISFFCIGLFLAGFIVYNREWFREILTGPVAISPDELSQAKSLQSLPSRLVRLEVAEYKETKVRQVSRRRSVQVTEYPLIRVADRWLPAAMDPGPRPRTVVGYLSALEESGLASSWDPSVMPDIARAIPAKDTKRLLPFRLDAKQNYNEMGRVVFFGCVGLSVLSFAVAGLYLRKLWATSPGEVPPSGDPFVTAPEKAPTVEAWRWR
jgi:hypothetical protein